MKESIKRFLEFNGKTLLFLAVDGTYWIAVKPVCEALNVQYEHQYKRISRDPILGPALCKYTMQVPGDQVRMMVALPEYLIYGWIFSISSSSPQLLEYKKECFQILYNHFHGTITRRKELISRKAALRNKLVELESTLRDLEDFKSWETLKAEEARIGKALKEIDQTELNEQLKLFQ